MNFARHARYSGSRLDRLLSKRSVSACSSFLSLVREMYRLRCLSAEVYSDSSFNFIWEIVGVIIVADVESGCCGVEVFRTFEHLRVCVLCENRKLDSGI